MTEARDSAWPKTVVEDGMRIIYNVSLAMADGAVQRADLYLPIEDGRYPVIASLGAYGKNHPFQDPPYTELWNQLIEKYPEVLASSTGRHMSWEVPDPERWVQFGYAVLRIDSRGAGWSEGFMNTHSHQESVDYKEWIEWAARQPWSNGKVGLSGISYFAVNQWLVSTMQPEGLAALCIWEGASDWYRETNYHGGIPTDFLGNWFSAQARIVQHGLGSRGPRNPYNGMNIAGDVELTDEELAANRMEVAESIRSHPFDGEFWRLRSTDHSLVHTPLLSAGNWGGAGLHGRSNPRGFALAASESKYLEMHGGDHWTLYYSDYGLDIQKRFFDFYLKGEGDFDSTQPPVQLQVRHPGEKFVKRAESEWPIARTEWTPLYLVPGTRQLQWSAPGEETSATYEALGEGLTLRSEPFTQELEFTGPVTATLFISSDTTDADIFAVLHLFDPSGAEVHFQGANEPNAPIGQGWLRASHRRVDPDKSLPWQPFHPHLEEEPLTPGEIYELEVEIWPTSIVVPPGYSIGFSVLGRDYDNGKEPVGSHIGPRMRGSAFFLHPDRGDKYDNHVTVYGGSEHPSRVILPKIPPKNGE
ncbi:CocE/NonD family hydrolase [Microbacterium sp. RD1]|uniref:CocE/NonD family hydrolase n=1 Tax=Microbacterium sp. RD1 TaxID=3457313 RepID=UPI003FA56ABB